MKFQAFVVKTNGLLHELPTDVWITPPTLGAPGSENRPATRKLRAVWDTGASVSVINVGVAHDFDLVQTGIQSVSTANGTYDAATYMCDLYLPNPAIMPDIEVAEANLGPDLDMLIGMDVISRGDFAVTNLNDETWFTFRLPSIQRANFINGPNPEHKCPCGSVKKYKNCCGPLANHALQNAFKKP